MIPMTPGADDRDEYRTQTSQKEEPSYTSESWPGFAITLEDGMSRFEKKLELHHANDKRDRDRMDELDGEIHDSERGEGDGEPLRGNWSHTRISKCNVPLQSCGQINEEVR